MNDKTSVSDHPSEFQWLHLSDLHVGVGTQDWLWPTLKQVLYHDLENLHSRVGAWDTVIFSGDFTQRGAREEFDKLDVILADLWKRFRQLGFSPSLVVLPGNHDVTRPTVLTPSLRVLKKWWEELDIHDEFFSSPSSPYRIAISELFSEYNSWQRRLSKSEITIVPNAAGLLPGDQSAVIEKGALRVGLVGLNSTWLQIDSDSYFGRLHVDPRQLASVTRNDPGAWCAENTLNMKPAKV